MPDIKAKQIKGIKEKPINKAEAELLSKLPGISDVYSAAEFIKPVENVDTMGAPKLDAHKDVNGQIIVGWGTRADDLKEGDKVTEAEAQSRLNKNLGDLVAAVKRNGGGTAWDLMDQGEKDRLLSVMHNVGVKGTIFGKGKDGQYTEFWKAIISGDKEKAAQENDFGKASGHERRRQSENKRARGE